MKPPAPPVPLTCLLLSLFFVSCTVQVRLDLTNPNQTAVQTTVSLQKPVLSYWADLRQLDDSLPPSPLDAASLRTALTARTRKPNSGLTDPQVQATAQSLSVGFIIKDWSAFQRTLPGQTPLVQITTAADQTEWTVQLDRASLQRLLALTTYSQSPALTNLLPDPQAAITARDYATLLQYQLEPYSAAAASLIAASTVELTLDLPRPALKAEGAVSRVGNSVVYRWPLTQILALERPLSLHVVF